ncbi:MAG: mechanosensitive ion channel family protein [Sphaerochaetaceae bacterium]|jgi:small conductance mechanosensitive channel
MIASFMALASTADATATDTAAAEMSFFSQLERSLENLTNEGFVAFLWDLVIAILIIVVGKLLIMFFTRMFKRMFARSKKINELMAKFLLKVISSFGWILVALVLFEHMGIDMTPIIAGLGVTGVILGFAFQESIGNLLSGVMIVINAPFRIGDYVDLGSMSGTVTNMDLMCVTLATPDNKQITLANKLVWGNPITNYSYTPNRRVDMIVSVAYGSDLQKVKADIRQLFDSYPEVLKDPVPTIEVSKLNDSSVDLIARPWTLPGDYWKIFWRFQTDIYDKLTDDGISIPFPQLDVNLYDIDRIGGDVRQRRPASGSQTASQGWHA